MNSGPIVDIPDRLVDAELDSKLRALLLQCFSHETVLQTRRFVHEPPTHRFMLFNTDGSIRAHVAVHRKRVAVGGVEVEIGGIAEVAVDPAHRGQGYVRTLMKAVHEWLIREGVPFAILFGHNPIYLSSGYRPLGSPVRFFDPGSQSWKEEINGAAMVRELGATPWPEGLTDLRGPMF